MSPSTLKRRPCSYCGRWFRPSPRLKGRQTSCGTRECQRARKADSQARWRRSRVTYDEVPRVEDVDSIRAQGSVKRAVSSGVLPGGLGDSIHAQARVLAALVARLPPRGGGDSIRARLSELHAQGGVLLGEIG